MKNLKKVLALGLALVMVLGMFTVASAAETKKIAADFTDWDKVEHKDAVALCVDLGIINGLPDGSFAPDQTIDRASWAKLVYFTATGDDNADAYLGTATDLKDITGNWAESYISYLYATGRVSGDGTGNYMPAGTITVAAGLKTMLTVLGYDADSEGYQGTSAWAGNVITDAKMNGLMNDIDRSNTANVNLTRDNAAQIIYNTLQAKTVKPTTLRDQGTAYVASYTTLDPLGKVVFDAIPVTVNVTVDTAGNVQLNPVGTAGDDYPSGLTSTALEDVAASSTLAGESAVVWVKVKNNGNFDSVVSSAVAKVASSATKVFTDGVELAKITTDEDDDHYVGAGATGMKIYVDGADKTASATTAKRGDVVEVYTAGEKVSAIKVTTWNVGKLTGDAETRTSGGKLQVRLPGITGLSQWKDTDTVEGYQGLAEGDVILFNKDAKSNFIIEKAEKVTGKVTERSSDTDAKLTMNGKEYQVSKINGVPALGFDDWNVKGEKDNEYDFYLDKNGTVCYKVLVEGEVTKEVAYVLDAAYVTGSGIKGSYYAEAELLFTDGTTEIVTVASVGGTDMDKDAASTGPATMAGLVGKFVDYSVSDKAYTLETKDTTTNIGTAASGSTEATLADIQNQIKFIKNVDTASANDKTVFIVKKGDKYEIFTGFENVPKMKAIGAYVAATGKAASYVYLETDSYDGEAPEAWIYVADKEAFTVNTKNLKVYEVYTADGTKTKMPVHKDVNIDAEGFYKVDKVNESEGNSLTKVTDASGELKAMADSVLEIGTTKVPYDKSTVGVVVDIDKDGKFVSVSSFDPASFSIEDSSTYTYAAWQDGGDVDAAANYIYVIRSEVGATEDEGEEEETPSTPSNPDEGGEGGSEEI